MSSKPRIQVQGLTKTYHLYRRPGDRLLQMVLRRLRPGARLYQEFHALRDVSFTVADGEVLGIVGQNGAGKSTLLQLVCGTLTPTAGTVTVRGRVAALLELGAGFNPEFTGRENVYLSAAVLGLSRAEIDARFDAMVDFAGIGPFLDQPVKTYSSGMFVRLAFAVASSVDPDILVIDEALAVGDGAFARKSFERILELKERGVTILFCSHALYQIEAFCTRALWLDAGQVRMLGAPAEVVAAYGQHLAALAAPPAPAPQAAPAPPPAGSGRITGVRVRLDGHEGQDLAGRSGESRLEVAVSFSLDPALPDPTVGVVLDYGTAVAAASAVTKSDGAAVTRHPSGCGVAVVTFPALALRKGPYRVSAYLACEGAMHLYDQAVAVASLTLEDPAPEPGLVRLPHGWRTGHLLVHGRPFRVDAADSLGLLATGGVFEPAETAFLERVLRPGMRCLDAGANMGYHTLRMAQLVGPEGLVTAVEPHPANQELLAANLAPEIAAGLVRLVPAALGAASGRLRLYQAANGGMHRLYPSVTCGEDWVEVDVIPGDTLELAPLHLVKLDVEGAEPAVLAGLAQTLAASPDVALLAEFSPLAMREAGFLPQDLVAALADQGFVPHELAPHGRTTPVDPAALAAACSRIPEDGFQALLAAVAGKSAQAQAEAATAFLHACGYGRPLVETLVWQRR